MHVTHKKEPTKTSYQMKETILETVTNHTYLGGTTKQQIKLGKPHQKCYF